jgi:hypothetical protein
MRKSGLLRSFLLALVLVAPLVAGCGSNPFNPPIDPGGGLPVDTPLNDTPQNLMLRFEASYENQVLNEYEKLFTSNFRFTFSSQSDQNLVDRYGTNWGKDDEIESTSHLFDGFTNETGQFQGPASAITLSLAGAQFIDEPTQPDSGSFYKRVYVSPVSLRIEIAATEETIYDIAAPHEFYLVRGDVALLDGTQEARADRWYVYRWDDKSPAIGTTAAVPRLASLTSGMGPIRTTWGNLKSSYVPTP